MAQFTYDFSVAGVRIQMRTELPLTLEEPFVPFLSAGCEPAYTASFHLVERLPEIPDAVVHEDDSYRIHPDGQGGFLRSFFDSGRDVAPYAVTACDYRDGLLDVYYLQKGIPCVSEMTKCFFYLGLEQIMLRENRVCLHAACVDTSLGGILFSGPSGIGKSTQADLWVRYRGSKLINGDRPVVAVSESGLRAWGSPYAGSSKCYVNENCPVSAIIMLQQAPQCSIRRLKLSEAFRKIYSGLIVRTWDRNFVDKAAALALQVAETIPVYEFSCTPDEAAVDFLEKTLREGNQNEWPTNDSAGATLGISV